MVVLRCPEVARGRKANPVDPSAHYFSATAFMEKETV